MRARSQAIDGRKSGILKQLNDEIMPIFRDLLRQFRSEIEGVPHFHGQFRQIQIKRHSPND